MKKFFRRFLYSIKTKILWVFILCVIIPSILCLILLGNSYLEYIKHSIVEGQKSVLQEMKKNIEDKLESYQDKSMYIYYNEPVRSYIDGGSYQESSWAVEAFLSEVTNSESYVYAAIMKIQDHIYGGRSMFPNPDPLIEEWEDEVMAENGKCVWIPTRKLNASYGRVKETFVLSRAVNSRDSVIGSFWLFISTDLFASLYKNPVFQEYNSNVYLIAEDYTVITSNQKSEIGEIRDTPFFQKVMGTSDRDFIWRDADSGKESLVVTCPLQQVGWKFVIVTYKEAAFRQVNRIKVIAVLVIIFYLGFLVFAYYILSYYIFHPLKKVSDGLACGADGDFRILEKIPRQDEIASLTDDYNFMVQHIQSLIEAVRREELMKNQEKMKILTMQIGPHFLYNTLNTIKWTAAVNRQENIRKMTESLMFLMKEVTYRTDKEITFKEELALLDSYVYIQKIRFMNFEVRYQIPDELLDCTVRSFILQPFVENAILHAFRDMEGMGMITINAVREAHALVVGVSDNGRGMTAEELDEISRQVETEGQSKGLDQVGIQNVRDRIRLYYGEEYGVSFESEAGRGTKVLIRLPFRKEVERDD